MTAAKPARCCDVCRLDNSWHYDEDGNATRCPNYLSAEQLIHARELTEQQNTSATEAARRIVRDGAERLPELSANVLRSEIAAAQLDGRPGVMGAAFSYAQRQGWIEWTGRTVASNDPATKKHHIFTYSSLVYRRGEKAS